MVDLEKLFDMIFSKEGFTNFKEALIGAFVASIAIFSIRAGNPLPSVNPWILLLITAAFLSVYYGTFKKRVGNDAVYYMTITYLAVYVICTIFAFMFNLVSEFHVLSPSIIIPSWLAFTTASVFNLFNISNPLQKDSYWARK